MTPPKETPELLIRAGGMVESIAALFPEVVLERARQAEQWGGTEIDDGRSLGDWTVMVDHKMSELVDPARNMVSPEADQYTLVQVIALAVAALQSQRRIQAKREAEAHVNKVQQPCECPLCLLKRKLQDRKEGAEIRIVEVGSIGELLDALEQRQRRR